jgi:hypothetical protein
VDVDFILHHAELDPRDYLDPESVTGLYSFGLSACGVMIGDRYSGKARQRAGTNNIRWRHRSI